MASFVPLVIAMAVVMAAPAYGQISTPCNASMLSSVFSPCVGFLTNSSANGTSPTTGCCNSLKSLTGGSLDCLCLIVTASVPITLPINRTLAISLPRACNVPGVPVQCKAAGSPLPAPGPVSLGPSASPASSPSGFTPSPSPQASADLPSPVTPSLAPQSEPTPPLLTPPSPSVDSGSGGSVTPSASTGTSGHSDLTPSSSSTITSYSVSPSVLLIAALGFGLLKFY